MLPPFLPLREQIEPEFTLSSAHNLVAVPLIAVPVALVGETLAKAFNPKSAA